MGAIISTADRWSDGDFRVVHIQLTPGWRFWAFGPDGWDSKYGLDPNGYASMQDAIAAIAKAIHSAQQASAHSVQVVEPKS